MDSILSKIAEYTIEPIGRLLGRQVGYVIHCKTNLQKLKDQVEELRAAREATENNVAEAKTKGEKIQPDVQLWLTKVGEITKQTDELLSDESQAKLKCLHGFCPNLTVRHRLSRKSTKLVEEVVEHYAKRGLTSQVSCGILRKEVCENRDYQAFKSRTSIEQEIMDHLSKIERPWIGVCGVGGVGKTTLVKEVYNQASEKKLFDNVVILLDVKKNPDLEAIQKIIVDKLGMEIRENETKEGRASRLCGRIQDKKVLVIFDDVQEKIDLEAVGLPRLPTCKILLTCRTPEVFDEMRVDKVFRLDLLDKQDTWNLFVKMAGDVINQNGGIRDVAIKVAERCGGLPLLVVTVASALKQKNKLHAWKDALRRLKRFDKDELTEKAYLALEWSYDQLDDKELQPLFLLSGIIMVNNSIDVQDLLKYGMGLSLFKNVNTVEEAHNALDSLLEKLKDSCLLLDSDTERCVRMHDLVCHVAKRIAYRDQHVLSVEYGGELKEWPNKDSLRKCTNISLPLLNNIPTLSEIPLECPNLELFYLHSRDDNSVEIPSNFFREMQKLKVLDLSGMSMPSLPLSLESLKKLRTLCLDDCTLGDITLLGQLSNLEILSFFGSKVKELPKEIGQLTRLRLLDLSNCYQLRVIAPTVISSLVRLEDLRMRNSFNNWEVEGEGTNASLSELKHLSELSALEIRIPNADVLPANLFSHKLERFNIVIGDAYSGEYMTETTLNTLKLKLTKSIKELDEGLKLLLKRSEDLSLDETEVVIINQLNTEDFKQLKHLQLQNSIADIINRKVFPNLSTLRVYGCDNLRFLFSFSMARSLVQLTRLQISKCKLMQEIVSSTRECGSEEENEEVLETTLPQFVFPKVTSVTLKNLPQLRRFYPGLHVSRWPLLKEMEMVGCDKVEIFAAEFSMFREKHETESLMSQQPLFIIDKDSFLNLECLTLSATPNEIWNGPTPAELVFGKLKSITFDGNCAPFSNQALVLFLERLQNLEEIEMRSSWSSSEREIFVNRGISSSRGEIRDDAVGSGTLPRVRTLRLVGMYELMHLGNDNSQSGPVLFPNLEILEVLYCARLKSVGSSSAIISFRNLTTLTVLGCEGLEYLTTYSVAKSLVQLTTLKVRSCYNILVIVASNVEDDDVNEIAFSRLQHLQLYGLQRLQGFCSGNCTVKFPSSITTLDIDECPIKLKISPDGMVSSYQMDSGSRNPEILSQGPPAT